MDFLEVVKQARAALQSERRITYRVLKRQFALDDESLEDLKEQLIEAEELAVDKDGKMLVWTGDGQAPSPPSNGQSQPQSPASYTPQHLAEHIRAEQAAMESRGAADGERKNSRGSKRRTEERKVLENLRTEQRVDGVRH